MTKFLATDRSFCIGAYYQKNKSAVSARRAFMSKFKLKRISQCPSTQSIITWVKKFEKGGNLENQSRKERVKPARTPETIETVREILRTKPQLSQRKIAAAIGVSQQTVNRIQKFDLLPDKLPKEKSSRRQPPQRPPRGQNKKPAKAWHTFITVLTNKSTDLTKLKPFSWVFTV